MSGAILYIEYAQMLNLWDRVSSIPFSDDRKKTYVKQLDTIINGLARIDFQSIHPRDIQQYQDVIFFLYRSLEFLNNSTLNHTPWEMIYVLEAALGEWLKDDDSYLVTTFLGNPIRRYSFDQFLAINQLIYDNIFSLFDLKFSQRLIQINLPYSQYREYLTNVILFHELGHFIDVKYKISEELSFAILEAHPRLPSSEKEELEGYFPSLRSGTTEISPLKKQLVSYCQEYFADLFAAQYVGESCNFHLDYLDPRSSSIANTSHPDSEHRIENVNSFLEGRTNFILSQLSRIIPLLTEKEISIRYKEPNPDAIQSLFPAELQSIEEVYGLFPACWKIYLNDTDNISVKNRIAPPFSKTQLYNIVNSLLEKSIGNYIVLKKLKNVPSEK